MWYEGQSDNLPTKSQCVKMLQLQVKVHFQHGAVAHIEHHTIKGPTKFCTDKLQLLQSEHILNRYQMTSIELSESVLFVTAVDKSENEQKTEQV